MPVVRDFRDEHSKGIVRLHRESSENFEEQEITEDFIHNITRRNDFRFFIMTLEGRIIGFIGVLFHVNVKRAEIGPICVDSSQRGKGVGTKLLNHTIDFLRQKEVRRTIVKIKSNNGKALVFFKKNGFVEEGYFKSYTGKGEDVIQLRRFV